MQDQEFMGRVRRGFAAAAVLLALAPVAPAAAQVLVTPCDIDIADDLGRGMWGSTIHLIARPGEGSEINNTGTFVIINGNTPEFDVDRDGYNAPGACDFTGLFIALVTPLRNQANPVFVIPPGAVIVTDFPRNLLSGERAEVTVRVEVPDGTPAGTYQGLLEVRDRPKSFPVAPNSPTSDPLGLDVVRIEVEVVPQRAIGLVNADVPAELDSLTIRGRAGTRASGVLRVANLGNVALGDVRLSVSDLRSESAVPLVIPASRVSISPPSFASLGLGDTARVTVTVDIPRGTLGGRYRGTLIAQGTESQRLEIPLIVVVTSSRGILFASNPVRSSTGDLAQIAFNADPGTTWRLIIMDMDGMVVFTQLGNVFAGQSLLPNGLPGPVGTQDNPAPGADFSVNVTWPLVNGRGESVASGVYLVVVESFVTDARGVRQRQQSRDRLMVIR